MNPSGKHFLLIYEEDKFKSDTSRNYSYFRQDEKLGKFSTNFMDLQNYEQNNKPKIHMRPTKFCEIVKGVSFLLSTRRVH